MSIKVMQNYIQTHNNLLYIFFTLNNYVAEIESPDTRCVSLFWLVWIKTHYHGKDTFCRMSRHRVTSG